MLETFGERQRQLLVLLLNHKTGLTVDDLSSELQITRNAVRQHLTTLERDDLIRRGDTKPSGGRPEQLYLLTGKGAEMFPRRYSWFSELLIAAMSAESGAEAVGAKLATLGRQVGRQLGTAQPTSGLPDRVAELARIMQDLGYAARVGPAPGATTIEASNCVFHHLAARFPQVCRFDLGLMGAFANATVEHQECMVRGGGLCRFKLSPAPGPADEDKK